MSFRIEEKIIVDKFNLNNLKKYLYDLKVKPLYPSRKIKSLYFENSNYDTYNESAQGISPRSKIRIRNYPDTSSSSKLLEYKINSPEGRYKKSYQITESQEKSYQEFGIFDKKYGQCMPMIYVSYNREYLIYNNVRITVDTNIKYNHFYSDYIAEDEYCCAEFKCSYYYDRDLLLKQFPFSRLRFSKYARGIENLLKSRVNY